MVKENRWMDGLSLLFSTLIVVATSAWLLHLHSFDLTTHANWVWYMVRSAGITAYILMTFSILWGLAVSSRAVKDWSPGVLSMLLHGSISWLAVVFAIGHA